MNANKSYTINPDERHTLAVQENDKLTHMWARVDLARALGIKEPPAYVAPLTKSDR